MTLSIIIATYNAEKGLKKTLDSILIQTWKDYEVMVVDGGSSDKTLEILKKNESIFKGKLRWISEKDQGIYDAMNKGINLAKGEWLYFLGSGDVFYDKNVLKMVSGAMEENIDVLYGSVQVGDHPTPSHGRFNEAKLINQNICHQAVFARKGVFKKTGPFDLNYPISADHLFNMKWFTNRDINHKYIETIIAYYDETGLSSNNKDKRFRADKKMIVGQSFTKRAIFESRARTLLGWLLTAVRMFFSGNWKGLVAKVAQKLRGKNEK